MAETALTVSELTTYIKNLLLQDKRLNNVLVSGEISNFKHHSSGHMYFTLKDQTATLRCIMFKSRAKNLDFQPQDGMDVIAQGFVGVYEKAGLYQLYTEKMFLGGTGSLYLALEQLKENLKKEGLFEEKYKQPIPHYPKRIVVITSPTGAAVRDMIVTISRRFPLAKITLIPVRVQGEYAAGEISAAIEYANCFSDVDVILLGRGGGSLEEIWPFNTEQVARSIFASKIPVVSCVGHETDFTISDFVADLRAPTPTAAAELVVPDSNEITRKLEEYHQRLNRALNNKLYWLRQKYYDLITRPALKHPKMLTSERKRELEYLTQSLQKEHFQVLQRRKHSLAKLNSKLESLNPANILERGYVFCQSHDGKIIKSINEVSKGDFLHLYFSDGKADAHVESKQLHNFFPQFNDQTSTNKQSLEREEESHE